jgi:hypothetical protein
MKRFEYQLIRALFTSGALAGMCTAIHGCGETAQAVDAPQVGVIAQPLGLTELAQQCGFVCPGGTDADGVKVKTLLEGNASISGVPAVDGFFSSVLDFQTAANGVSAGIDAELDAIRADFQLPATGDLGVALKAKLNANLVAGFGLEVSPPVCKADFRAELDAAARCDVSATPGMVSVDCKGGCDVEAKADVQCDASAELSCTLNSPEVECKGQCTGTCSTPRVAAQCTGTCKGDCVGECSAWVKDASGAAKCQGQCTGTCSGSCEVAVTGDAGCSGTCSGECTLTRAPSAGCEGGVRAQCKATGSASIKCDTKCDGEFDPPMVKAECQAKVHADAKLKVQCTPPHVAFNYRIKANLGLTVTEQVRFEAAMKSLIDVRLPALKLAMKRSELVNDAGVELGTASGGAFKAAIDATRKSASADIKVLFGLGCAADQLPNVKRAIDASTAKLQASVNTAQQITNALNI